jgi:hypothetical protein
VRYHRLDRPGLNTPMVIVVDSGDDVQRYAQEFAQLRFPVPAACPHCAVVGRLIGHGSYGRAVAEPSRTIAIRIKRLLCTACRHTFSLVPSFCLPWRHYATATIQTVLDLRIRARVSWRTLAERFAPAEVPTRTTWREWVDAFTQTSTRYLPALVRQLASWSVGALPVDLLVDDLAKVPPGPTQLIAAVPHLLTWLSQQEITVRWGTRTWLATLWRWGNGGKLGRVV